MMSPKDYLIALYDALEGLPPQVRTDIISEYKEFFRTEAENGRTDEAIIASLGDPAELALVIKNQRGYHHAPPPPPHRPFEKRRSPLRTIFIWMFTVVIIMGLFSGIGFAVKFKGKGKDNMAFGLGTRYDVNEIKGIELGSAEKIEILTTSPNTEIFAVNTDQVRASLTGHVTTTSSYAVPSLEVYRSGQVITIAVRQEKNIAAGFTSGMLKLDIEIPDDFSGDIVYNGSSGNLKMNAFRLNNLKAELTSGDIRINNLSIKNELYLANNSGNMTIHEVTADRATLRSTSGDKSINELHILGDIEIRSNSGNTRIDGVSCGRLDGECTSGNVILNRIKLDSVSYRSHSGNVVLKSLEGAASIEATSGNIELDVADPKGEYHLAAHSGNISLDFPSQTSFSLNARVNSGRIRCEFDLKNESEEKRNLSGIAGSGEIPVEISTTSGNIHISKR